MAKSLTEIRSLARSHTRTAVNVLVGIMRSKDATAAARVSAANAILDRGWGKAAQPHEGGPDGAIALVHRIERVIVLCLNSLTIAWGYLLALLGAMLQVVDAAGDVLGDPAIKDQVSAAVGDPTWSGRVLLAISIVTLAARLRSIRKQS